MKSGRVITSKVYGELGRFAATRRPNLYRSPSGRVLVLGEGALGGKGEGTLYLDKAADEMGFRVPGHSLVVCNDHFGIPTLPKHRVRELDPKKSQELMGILGEEKFPARLAIRSSSVMEDQPGHTAAGLFTTHYHDPQRSKGDLWTDLVDVLNSNYAEGALIYQRSRGVVDIPPLPVIIQELVGSEFKHASMFFFPAMAGVVNTASPGRIKVATMAGFGRLAVKGFGLLHIFDLSLALIEESEHFLSCDVMEGGEEKVNPNDRKIEIYHDDGICTMRRLTPLIQSKLAQIAIQLQARIGFPLDIEWALASEGTDHPHLLQVRPLKPKQSLPKPAILPAEVIFETSEVHGQARHPFSHVIMVDCRTLGIPDAGQLERISSFYPDNILMFIGHIDQEAPINVSIVFPHTRAVILCDKASDGSYYYEHRAMARLFQGPTPRLTALQHTALFCADEEKLILYKKSGWEEFILKIREIARSKEVIISDILSGLKIEVFVLPEPHTIAGSDEDGWGIVYRGEPLPPRK
jgi:hypothetical protein